MTDKGKTNKYLGIGLVIFFVVSPIIGIPLGLYFSTPRPSVSVTYNYDTIQEKNLIDEFELIGTSSHYFSNILIHDMNNDVLNISEQIIDGSSRVRRILKEYELNYVASIGSYSSNNFTRFNSTFSNGSSFRFSYYNATTDNYTYIANGPNYIYDVIEFYNDTGLLDDGSNLISYTLSIRDKSSILKIKHTTIGRSIICDSEGKPILIFSVEGSYGS